jgi:sugar phosphate isomerase/epimerase
MECPLHANDQQTRKFSKSILLRLLEICHQMDIQDVVIPCVDQSSLSSSDDLEIFKQQMKEVAPIAEKLGVNLSLETDLPPQSFKELLDDLNSNSVAVNYDTGNSASLGYDFREELCAYGDKITDLHIKDRTFRGGSIFIGDGEVDFESFFKEFMHFDFEGPIIMQAYRDEEGLSIFTKQLDLLKSTIGKFNGKY